MQPDNAWGIHGLVKIRLHGLLHVGAQFIETVSLGVNIHVENRGGIAAIKLVFAHIEYYFFYDAVKLSGLQRIRTPGVFDAKNTTAKKEFFRTFDMIIEETITPHCEWLQLQE